MKNLVGIFFLILTSNAFSYTEKSFTVLNVGASKGTNTVFVNVEETATDTECTSKNLLRMDINDTYKPLFYATALAAHAQAKPFIVGYEADSCIQNSVAPILFKIGN